MDSSQWVTCYILNRRAYRETSFIVDAFCRDLGRVSFVAKGVRSAKSDRRSLLQPLQPLRVQLTGKAELKNLRNIEATNTAIPLTGKSLFCAFYVNELTARVLPKHVAAEQFYDTYVSTLNMLVAQDAQEPVLRQFEFALLHEMGVFPDLHADCVTGDPIEAALSYRLMVEEGITQTLPSTKGAFEGGAIIDMLAQRWNEQSLFVAKRLCRIMLAGFLGDKPLKSRELFTQLPG